MYIYIYTHIQELHGKINYVNSPNSRFYREVSEYQIKDLSKLFTDKMFSIIEFSSLYNDCCVNELFLLDKNIGSIPF